MQALGRPGLSDAAQHALVTTMMTMLLHDDVKEASSAMMQASPAYLPILLRIIDQEHPVAAYRDNPPPLSLTFTPLPFPIALPHYSSLFALFLQSCSFEAIRSIIRFIFGKHAKTNVPKLPMGLPRALVRVVDSETDTDNRTIAISCLVNMAAYAPASVLTNSEAVACALRVIQEQGTGAQPLPPPLTSAVRCSLLHDAPLNALCFQFFLVLSAPPHPCADMTAWAKSAKFGLKLMNRTVDFLSSASGAAVGAHMLRHMDAQSALLPISFLPDDDYHTANSALMCLINIMGNQEAAKGEDSPIMVIRPDVVGLGNAPRWHCAPHLTAVFSSADGFRQYS